MITGKNRKFNLKSGLLTELDENVACQGLSSMEDPVIPSIQLNGKPGH